MDIQQKLIDACINGERKAEYDLYKASYSYLMSICIRYTRNADRAKEVLGKVAKVVNSRPTFECMVEGHTDSVPYIGNNILLDNWDLSVKRSTSIIRVLTNELGVNPSQLIAAGRSSYVPLVANDSADNRSRNRRTRIVVLPKIDQFYEMIEKEMKNPKQ